MAAFPLSTNFVKHCSKKVNVFFLLEMTSTYFCHRTLSTYMCEKKLMQGEARASCMQGHALPLITLSAFVFSSS